MNRNRYDMDELLDDDLMAELTERTFQRVEGDRLGKGGRLRKTVGILVVVIMCWASISTTSPGVTDGLMFLRNPSRKSSKAALCGPGAAIKR